jgi:aldehyde:ferredoxin oxidoreductase
MEHILRVDVSKQEAKKEKSREEDRLMGGRGLSARILNREVDPLCHPLGIANKLVIAPGLLAGTLAPSFGRISVGGKSPLTGGIKEANAGGTAAQKLDRLGIKAIIVEGKPADSEFSILKISKDECRFLPANGLAGKRNYELVSALQKEHGDKIGVISIGPCGEMRMSASSVAITDADGRPSRHAARGGLGAVMGSKGLKAIVIDDEGASRVELANRQGYQEAVKGLVEMLKQDKGAPALNSLLGTPGVIGFVSKLGSMPAHNYHSGSFEQVQNLTGQTIKEVNSRRGGTMHGCMPGCVIQCSIVFNNEEGSHLTSALEYETLALLGTNLGIGDLDVIARMDRLSDDLGLDTIEIGSAIAQAMEAGEIPFGDGEGAMRALEEVGKGTPFGRILGHGTALVAQAFGLDRVPAVRRQAIPAHDPRVCKPVGVTYATSAMGADHTAGIDYRDSLSREGQVKKSRQAQIAMATIDSVGYCMLAMPTKAPAMMTVIASLLNARYGTDLTDHEVLQIGAETIKEELAFNQKAGIEVRQDPMPDFLKTEPVPPQNSVFDIPRAEIEAIWQDL